MKQLIPPADYAYASNWYFNISVERIQFSSALIYRCLFPFPQIQINFWNSNILDSFFPGMVLMSIVILFCCHKSFIKYKGIYISFLIMVAGVLIFSYIKFQGYLRHSGHIFLIFLACCWLLKIKIRTQKNSVGWVENNYFKVLFNVVISVQFCASVVPFIVEYKYPFSNAQLIANTIVSKKLENNLIVAFPEYLSSSVSGYLNKKLFHPSVEKEGSFIVWNQQYLRPMIFDEMYSIAIKNSYIEKRPLVFLLGEKPDTVKYPLKPIVIFPPTIVSDEQFFLYALRD